MLQTATPTPATAPSAFMAELDSLSPHTLRALREEAPDTMIDAMIVVIDSVARLAGHTPDIDLPTRTLTFANPSVAVTVTCESAVRVRFTARRVGDGALLATEDATGLGVTEVVAGLFTQRFRAAS
jgi:hypothetical protein